MPKFYCKHCGKQIHENYIVCDDHTVQFECPVCKKMIIFNKCDTDVDYNIVDFDRGIIEAINKDNPILLIE